MEILCRAAYMAASLPPRAARLSMMLRRGHDGMPLKPNGASRRLRQSEPGRGVGGEIP
jgi:hypothetical protein